MVTRLSTACKRGFSLRRLPALLPRSAASAIGRITPPGQRKTPKTSRSWVFPMELLTRFELVTSSLPTAGEPSKHCYARLLGSFLSEKDEVAHFLFRCFRPLVSPCGSRCGSGGYAHIKKATNRLRHRIAFYCVSFVIDTGDLLNEGFLLIAGFRPRYAKLSAHREEDTIPQAILFCFVCKIPLCVFHTVPVIFCAAVNNKRHPRKGRSIGLLPQNFVEAETKKRFTFAQISSIISAIQNGKRICYDMGSPSHIPLVPTG